MKIERYFEHTERIVQTPANVWMLLKARTLSFVDFLTSRTTVNDDLCKVAFNILATLFQLEQKYLRKCWEVRQTLQSIQILVVRVEEVGNVLFNGKSHSVILKLSRLNVKLKS